ncbi:MAG: hypothetical protein ABIR17_01760 [Pseudolysinimonas sp.]|uniref:hypothetical protein n=1 Tax=Pseudolysinimonas sp. TaxID=2680009 RepID=UPI003262DC9A
MYRLWRRKPFWTIAYAIVTTLGFVALLSVDIFLAVMLGTGRLTISAGLGATLALAIALPILTLTASWLFWVATVEGLANLATHGEFGRNRSPAFKKADRRFAFIAFFSLLIIPFLPILMVLH